MSRYEACTRCRGRGVIDVRHGTVYITDDDDERALAYHEEECPVCKGYRSRAVAERIERAEALAKELAKALREHREWHRNEYQSNQWIDARADAALARYDAAQAAGEQT